MRAYLAQSRAELGLTLRNGEALLVTMAIPAGLLAFFSLVDVLPTGDGEPVDFLAPGVLALAIMSTSMVSLGIATGFERSYGVLKRLAATPLGRPRLLAAKATATVAVQLVQVAVLAIIAFGLGWDPEPGLAVVGAAVLGTAAFAGLGLLLAGRLPALLNLASINALYLVLMLTGGIIFELDRLPSPLRSAAEALPAAPLASVLREALTSGTTQGRDWAVLGAWAIAAPAAAAALFRWE